MLTREAFLTFDNLTGDPSLDWVAQAAPQILAQDVTGVPKVVAMVVPTLRDAYLEHAARLVHGYYEMRSGKLHFEVTVEDSTGHRTVQIAAEDGQPGDAMNRAAKSLNSGARVFAAPDAAVSAWGHGDFEGAVKLDPSFSDAWLGWVRRLSASGDNAGAAEVAQRALAQPELDSPIDKIQLDMDLAALQKNDAARLEALRKLAGLVPYDPAVLVEVAELDMAARDFAAAVKDYRQALAASPAGDLWNALGYAQALAGDLEGARKSFQEYGRGPGEAGINSIDSLGEALFINGKFDEAARQFEDAYTKNPNFLEGETLWKAAHARLLGEGSGDHGPADQIAERYFKARAETHDPLVAWRRATWLYETGRKQQAADLLMHAPVTSPAEAALFQQQLRVWSNAEALPEDLEKLKQTYEHSSPVEDGLPRTLYAEALLRAGKRDEARALLQRWPLPVRDETPLQSLLYPKFLELRKQLS